MGIVQKFLRFEDCSGKKVITETRGGVGKYFPALRSIGILVFLPALIWL